MGTPKIEYALPQVGFLSMGFGIIGFAVLIISVTLSFAEIKGLHTCVSFIVLSFVTFLLGGGGITFSEKKFIQEKMSGGIIKGMEEISSCKNKIIIFLLQPLIATPFDENILLNVPYTVSFILFYLVIIIYAKFLHRILCAISETIFGVKP